MPSSPLSREKFWQVYWRMLKKTGAYLWAWLVMLILGQVIQQSTPFISRGFINALTDNQQGRAEMFFYALLGAFIISKVLSRLVVLMDRVVVPRTYQAIDVYAMQRILEKSYNFFTNTPSGQTLTKIKNLAFSFERFFGLFEAWFELLCTVVVTLVALAFRGVVSFAIAFAYLVASILFALRSANRIRPFEKAKTEARSKMVGCQADILTQAHTVVLFHSQAREAKNFTRYADAFRHAWMTRAQQSQRSMGMLFLFSTAFEVLTVVFLYSGWKRGSVTIGDIVLYQALVGNMIGQSMGFLRRFTEVREVAIQAEEAMTILDAPVDVPDAPRAKKLFVKHGEIILDAVSFGYNGGSGALKNISLVVRPGERLAVVGRSGAGKSTLVKLLLRLYNLESGEIRIDGQPIDKVTQASLREAISYVPQEPLLFHRSIRENIAYGNPDASERQIVAAAKRAHCHEFISCLPEKYDSLVGERGVKLSGGERQRVAIARAILKNSPILILDEATSALDPESEQLIQKAMEELMKGKTVIAIAHRLSTIRHMDRVIVLDKGQIVDEGTHDNLITRDTIYRDFWERQTEGYRG